MSTASIATFRAKLTLTTALMGGVIGIASPLRAQPALPTGGSVDVGTAAIRYDGVLPAPLSTSTRTDIDLASTGTVITWDRFNIGAGNTVSFNNALLSGTNPKAVLNRVVVGSNATEIGQRASDISGNLVSANNISVYIANPNGITFGTGANVNVGALIAAALDADTTYFSALNTSAGPGNPASVRFFGDPASTTGIAINGGTFNIQNNSTAGGQFVLLGAQVSLASDVSTPTTGVTDVAFVAGTDITMTNTAGSPLAFTITTGTAVPNAVTVAGNVAGRNVTLALASQDAVTDAILNVSGAVTATVATSSDRGVVLSAGTAAPGVTLSGTGTNGAARIEGNAAASTITANTFADGDPDTPPLTVPGAVSITARNGVSYAGNLSASGGIGVTGGDSVTLAGNVSAGGSYSVTSTSGGVMLGDTVDPRAQSAAGAVTISAATGITGRQRLTLTSNSDGVSASESADGLQLTTTGTAAAINFDATSSLVSGDPAIGRTLINVAQADANGSFTAGNLTASTLNSTTAGTVAQGITRNAALSFGTVDLFNAFVAVSNTGSVSTGGITVTGTNQGITLNAANTLTAPSTISASGNVSLIGANALDFTSVSSTAGSVLVRSTGAGARVGTLASQTAATLDAQGGDATLGTFTSSASSLTATASGTATVTGGVSSASYSVTGSGVVLGDAGGAPVTQGASGAVTITATGAGGITGRGGLTLVSNNDNAGDEALTLAGGTGGISFAAGTTLRGSLNQLSDIIVGNADAPLTLGIVNARGLIGSAGTRQISRSSTITVGTIDVATSLDLRATGTATISTGTITATPAGTDVTLATAGGALTAAQISAGRTVSLTSSGGRVTATNGIGAGGDLLISGASVALGGTLSAAAAVNITATQAGGISGTANTVLTSNSDGAGADALTLTTQAAGAPIDFASGSSLVGGTVSDRSDIRIAVSQAGDALRLGNVTGRSLLGSVGAGGLQTGLSRSGTITVGTIDLINTLALTSTAGNVSVDGVTVRGAGQGIRLIATAGSVTAPATLSASGDVTIGARDALSFDSVTSTAGATSVTASAGSVTMGTVSGATSATLSGTSATVSTAANSSGGFVSVTATNGNATVGSADAGTSVTVSATNGNATVSGAVTARSGAYTVSGSNVALGDAAGAPVTQAATGAVTLTATGTAGGVTGRSGLTLTGNSDGLGNEAVTFAAGTSGIGFAPGTQINGGPLRQSDVIVGTANAPLSLGNVTARGLIGSSANRQIARTGLTITTGTLDLAEALDMAANGANGMLQTGAITISGVNQSLTLASGGALTTGALTTQADITINAGGAVSLGTISATPATADLSVTTTGTAAFTASTITVGGNASLITGGTLSAPGAIDAGGMLLLRGAAVTLGDGDNDAITAGSALTVNATSGGAITGNANLVLTSGSNGNSGNDLTLDTTGAIAFAPSTTLNGGPLRQSALRIRSGTGTLALGTVNALTVTDIGGTTLNRSNATTFGDVTTTNTLTVTTTAGAALTAGAVQVLGAGQDVTLAASGTLTGTTLTAQRSATASGSGVTLDTLTARAGSASATANAGDLTVTTLTGVTGASGSAAAGSVIADTITTTNGPANVLARGSVRGRTGTQLAVNSTDGAVQVTAGDANLSSATAGTSLTVTANTGSLTLGTGTSGSAAILTAAAPADVTLGTLTAGTDATISAGGNIRADTITATGGAIRLTATAGEITGRDPAAGRTTLTSGTDAIASSGLLARFATISAGGDIGVNAGGAVDLVSATGTDIALNGASVVAPTLIARDDIAIRALGAVTTGVLTSGATTNPGLGPVDVSGTADALLAGAGLAGHDVDVTGSTVTIANATALGTGSDLRLLATAGPLTLATGVAGASVTIEARGPGGDVTIQTLTAANDVALTAAQNLRLDNATATSGRLAAIAAAGEVTGRDATSGRTTLTAAGDVQVAAGGTVRLGTLTSTATGGISVAGGAVDVLTAVAPGRVTMSANGPGLTAGRISGSDVELRLVSGALLLADEVNATGSFDARADAGSVAIVTAFASGPLSLNAGSDVTSTTATAGGAALIQAGSTLSIANDLTAASATLTAGGAANISSLTTRSGAVSLTAASATVGTLNAATTFAGTSRTGYLSLTTGMTGGAATFTSGGAGDILVGALSSGGKATFASARNARLGDITARSGDIMIAAAGQVTGGPAASGFGNANLRAAAGQVTVAGGTLAQLGTVDAATLIDVAADTLSATSATARGGLLRAVARTGALTVGTGSTTTNATLTATAGPASLGTLTAGGSATLAAGGAFTISNSATTGTTFDLIAGGAASVGTLAVGSAATMASGTSTSLGGATVGTTFTITAGSTATVGTGGIRVGGSAPTASNTLLIRSTDLDLGGTGATRTGMVSAGRITLVDRNATGTMRLGDNSGVTAGYALGDAELDLLSTPTLTFDATNGTTAHNVAIGTASLTDAAGSARIDVLTTGRIDLAGTITAAATGSTQRVLRLGGTNSMTGTSPNLVPSVTPDDTSLAALLVATATPDAGGRILLTGDTMVDLRANRIAFGQAAGFLGALGLTGAGTGVDFQTVANQYISQPASTLYNAQGIVVGGGAVAAGLYPAQSAHREHAVGPLRRLCAVPEYGHADVGEPDDRRRRQQPPGADAGVDQPGTE